MNDIIFGALILAAWVILQLFVFPRLGVNT